MFAASAQSEVYRCPGEEYRITRSVHLARLAAFYDKCRGCPHAVDDADASSLPSPAAEDADRNPSQGGATSLLGKGTVPPGHANMSRETQPSDRDSPHFQQATTLFGAEGARGRYLNEITRFTAERLAGALASRLWDDFAGRAFQERGSPAMPAVNVPAPNAAEGFRVLGPLPPGPIVVIAHDERPSSPDIVIGAGQALRRMGCQVVDLGLATRPCFLFAIDHLRAAGGAFVTGSRCDPGWTGLDFVETGGIPCSSPGELDRIAERESAGFSRPSRRAGSQRAFQAASVYESGLAKHFHALRPLRIALACPSRLLTELFERAFRRVACQLILVETPVRARNLDDLADADVRRTSHKVRKRAADLGILVEEDGEQCVFFDERGRIATAREIAALLAPSLGNVIEQTGREHVTRAMRSLAGGANFGSDGRGRYWFDEGYPACDALLALVHVLKALSRSDTPFSQFLQPA